MNLKQVSSRYNAWCSFKSLPDCFSKKLTNFMPSENSREQPELNTYDKKYFTQNDCVFSSGNRTFSILPGR